MKRIAKQFLDDFFREGDENTKALFPKGTRVYGGGDYSKVYCTTTGHFKRCTLDGCGGLTIRAVWEPNTVDNAKRKVAWLCEKGLTGGGGPKKKNWRIG